MLIYSAITSLDGYVADADGRFDWCMPDEEVHQAINEAHRSIGTHLYGRRMYEVMAVWETFGDDDESAAIRDWAQLWRAGQKVVYSTTLDSVSAPRTRLERAFAPEAVRAMAADDDVAVAGATLAEQAFAAGLVDEVHLFVFPVAIGGGLRALPDGVRLDLELVSVQRFGNGAVHLRHRVGRG